MPIKCLVVEEKHANWLTGANQTADVTKIKMRCNEVQERRIGQDVMEMHNVIFDETVT